jgi:twitching motility protein PilT
MQITTLEGIEKFQKDHELDFKYILPDGTSLRCNAAQERGKLSLSIRILSAGIPTIDELQLPDICKKLTRLERGLIIISGPTGSGKSTTQAAMIQYINANQTWHILSFEDPIEYSHTNIKSKITQRELGNDTYSFAEALKHALRHDPVIREGRLSQLADAIRDYGQGGNVTLDEALFKLYWDGIITKDTALKYSRDPEDIRKLTSDTLTRKNRPVDKP